MLFFGYPLSLSLLVFFCNTFKKISFFMDPFFYCMKNCFFLCPFDVNVVFFAFVVGRYFVKIVNWRSSVACDIGGGERPWKNSNARLVLEDGSIWKAKSFGASGTQVGEVFFNTSLIGWGYYESWDVMQSYPPRVLDRRLQEDWAKDAREGPRVLMSLRVDFAPMG